MPIGTPSSSPQEKKEKTLVFFDTSSNPTPRKKFEDIINAVLKFANNGGFSVVKGVSKTSAAIAEKFPGSTTLPESAAAAAVAESVMRGSVESYFSLTSFVFSMISVASYMMKLYFAKKEYDAAFLGSTQTMGELMFFIENMDKGEAVKLIGLLNNSKATRKELIAKIISFFPQIPFLAKLQNQGNDFLANKVAASIYSFLNLGDAASREKLGTFIGKFKTKQGRTLEEEQKIRDSKRAAREGRGVMVDHVWTGEEERSRDLGEIKERRRQKVAAKLLHVASLRQKIFGGGGFHDVMKTSELSNFVLDFTNFLDQYSEQRDNLVQWEEAILTKKEHDRMPKAKGSPPVVDSEDWIKFFESLSEGRRNVVVAKFRWLMADGDALMQKAAEVTKDDKGIEALRKKARDGSGASKAKAYEETEEELQENDWRVGYIDLIPEEDKQREERVRHMIAGLAPLQEMLRFKKTRPEDPEDLPSFLAKMTSEQKEEFIALFDEQDIYKLKIKLRNFICGRCWGALEDEAKKAWYAISDKSSQYLAPLDTVKAKRGWVVFRIFNLGAYGSGGVGYILRFLQYGGFIATAGAVGISCSVVCAVVTALGVLINAGTSLQGFYQKCCECNNDIWIDYPWYKKLREVVKLFFKYGTFGELAGGFAAVCTGFLFTVLGVAGVTNPVVYIVLFSVGLVCTATYFLSYMLINSSRDYKFTAPVANLGLFGSGSILAVSGLASTVTAILVFAGVISIPFISATGVGAVVLTASILVFGLASLAVGLYNLRVTKDSWLNKLLSRKPVQTDAALPDQVYESTVAIQAAVPEPVVTPAVVPELRAFTPDPGLGTIAALSPVIESSPAVASAQDSAAVVVANTSDPELPVGTPAVVIGSSTPTIVAPSPVTASSNPLVGLDARGVAVNQQVVGEVASAPVSSPNLVTLAPTAVDQKVGDPVNVDNSRPNSPKDSGPSVVSGSVSPFPSAASPLISKQTQPERAPSTRYSLSSPFDYILYTLACQGGWGDALGSTSQSASSGDALGSTSQSACAGEELYLRFFGGVERGFSFPNTCRPPSLCLSPVPSVKLPEHATTIVGAPPR